MLRHWPKFVGAYLVVLMLLGLLVSERWIQGSVQAEVRSLEARFGTRAREAVQDRATRWYNTVVIDTGFERAVWESFARTPEQRAKTPEFETGPFAAGLDWSESRVRVFLIQIYWVFFRLSAAFHWTVYLAFFIIPAIMHGWVRRRIKQANYASAAPNWYRGSLLLIGVSPVVTVLLFLLPFTLTIYCVPCVGILVGVASGIAVANAP